MLAIRVAIFISSMAAAVAAYGRWAVACKYGLANFLHYYRCVLYMYVYSIMTAVGEHFLRLYLMPYF